MSYFKSITSNNFKLCSVTVASLQYLVFNSNNNFISNCDHKNNLEKLKKSDWIDCYTSDGKIYYYNSKTLETSWEKKYLDDNIVIEDDWYSKYVIYIYYIYIKLF
jgi:hypothetical protein